LDNTTTKGIEGEDLNILQAGFEHKFQLLVSHKLDYPLENMVTVLVFDGLVDLGLKLI